MTNIEKKKIIKIVTFFLLILCIIFNVEGIINYLNTPELKLYDLSYLIINETYLDRNNYNNNINNINILLSKTNNKKINLKYLIFKIILFSFLFLFIIIILYLIKKINIDNNEYNKKINNIFIHKNGNTDELILI